MEKKSKFQDLKILELDGFGKTLITDLFTQSAETDEAIYHEALCQPAMLIHPKPRQVMICGGGEGSCLREVLRHNTVEKVIMVDIDQELVEFAQKYLPEWGENAWKDPRVEVLHEDARSYLQRCKKDYGQGFDVIVIDICDPTRDTLAIKLYEKEFFEEIRDNGALNPDFVIVQQCGPASQISANEIFTVIHNTQKQVFKNVVPFTVHIPSFFDLWGFNICYDSKNIPHPRDLAAKEVDFILETRLSDSRTKLKLYDGCAHQGLFGTPKWLRLAIENETRVISENTPVFMNTDYAETTGTIVDL